MLLNDRQVAPASQDLIPQLVMMNSMKLLSVIQVELSSIFLKPSKFHYWPGYLPIKLLITVESRWQADWLWSRSPSYTGGGRR